MRAEHPIILYDGVCGLCNWFVQFILKRDGDGIFRFAALQSQFARELLKKHGLDPDVLETVYLVTNHDEPHEQLRSRGRAVLRILRVLGGPWRIFTVFGILPDVILNLFYRLVARIRYRLFGKHDHCVLPDPTWKDRFIAAE